MSKNKVVFIDRDGTINNLIDRGENCIVRGKKVRYTAPWKLSEFSFIEGVRDGLEELGSKNFLRILVTNQPDLAYGTLPISEHEKIMQKLREIDFDDIFICPHGRNDNCDCKKPKTGLFLQAQEKWNIDLPQSFMLGDTENDMVAGTTVGCTTILIPSIATETGVEAHHTATSFKTAAHIVLTASNTT